MTHLLILPILFLTLGLNVQGQEITYEWSNIKEFVEKMNDSTTYNQIIELLGKPYNEFATPSLPEEYVLYFDIPRESSYMYWVILDTKKKTFLYWGNEKQKKE